MSFGLSLRKMKYIVSGPAFFFQPWYGRPSLLHIELVHTGASILTRSLYHKVFPVVFQSMWFSIGSTVIVYFLGSMQEIYSVPVCVYVFVFYAASILNMLGVFFNVVTWLTILVLELVLYLCVPVIFTLVSLFAVYPLLVSHWAAALLYPILFFQISFLAIFLFLV